ncbi:uncharacterized protein LOC106394937 isoform X4 [Brassica napus]|uniref:uncharacterized protein LOC106394937 isoform X4 n=1 Tax=Brassica napus TaxID=3708 RepID=UPI000BBE5CAB|nr:uncharacterized protein LOC106394937 isoform X4 [Brassica napus]
MEEPRQPESLSSCRNVSDVAYYVRNKVELCIQNYMSLEVTSKYLEKTYQISKSVTHIVWEQLREENPVFFINFEFRCQTVLQMRLFNDMLTKQAVRMFEDGLIDICDASPSVKAFLRRQHPERVHLMETSASKTKLSSASLAMPNANGPSVTQLPVPYDQQEQQDQHLYTTNLPFPYANGPSVTQLPIPNNQQDQHLYTTSLPLPVPSMTQLPIPNNQQNQPHQDPSSAYNGHICNSLGDPAFEPADTEDWMLLLDPKFADLGVLPPFPPEDTTNPWPSSSDDLPYTDPMPEDFSAFELGGDILEGMHPNERQQHLNGQYQPHWQQQNLQVEGSNGLANGEITDELLCNNFDITQSMQMDTIVHQQQAGGVNPHHLESEALNNRDSEATLVMQPSEQPQHQNGHYQPQQNVPVETVQYGGRSNGVVNGESSDQQFCNNFDKNHSKRMLCTSVVDEQQVGRVKRHQPESEALNNPNNGDGTQTNQQRSPEVRATSRSLKEWGAI